MKYNIDILGTLGLHLPRSLDKCLLTARPIQQLDSLSSKFKSLENHLLKWLRVEPVSIKAIASMLFMLTF